MTLMVAVIALPMSSSSTWWKPVRQLQHMPAISDLPRPTVTLQYKDPVACMGLVHLAQCLFNVVPSNVSESDSETFRVAGIRLAGCVLGQGLEASRWPSIAQATKL